MKYHMALLAIRILMTVGYGFGTYLLIEAISGYQKMGVDLATVLVGLGVMVGLSYSTFWTKLDDHEKHYEEKY